MSGRRGSYTGWQMLLLLLIFGGIIGGWIGEFLLNFWPALGILAKTQSVGLPNFVLNLGAFSLNFGFMLHLSFFSLLGFLLAYIVYRKM